MIFAFLNFLRGYLVIEAEGLFLERFINLAIKSNIFLWDIKKCSKNKMTLKISILGFKKIDKAAHATATIVRIKDRKGLPNFLHKHKKRKAFLIGIVLFGVIIVVLSSFIWSVEISGIDRIDENILRNELRSCGIDVGVIKYNHSPQEIKRKMMLSNPDIAWIWVDIKGTRAFVEVKERTEKPDIIPDDEPCNIIADCDGVIENTTILKGKVVVSEGDIVKKGDLLVSGVDDTTYTGPVMYHAGGEVYAMTWHEDGGLFPLKRTVKNKTNQTQSRFCLKIANWEMPIYPFSKIPFEKYEENTTEKTLKLWGDLYLPVSWKSKYIEEIKEETIGMSAEEAADFYAGELCKKMEQEFSADVKIINKDTSYEVQGDNIYVKCSLQCKEEIGQQAPLYKNDLEDSVD